MTGTDADRDGLADAVESALLEQFRPSFMVSQQDCDLLPATIAPGETTPRVLERDGAIYGQATPRASDGVELHYFHLWARDCGRHGHAADVEHVSALVRQASDGGWKAEFWYAAAHEETVCDRSMASRAAEIGAESQGPVVWISAGKHASYFQRESCAGGCGGDSCNEMALLVRRPIINLGEPGAPLNGAVWAGSPAWPLAAKMSPDFDDAMLRDLALVPATGPIRVISTTPGMQRAVSVSNTTYGGLDTAQQHTESGLGAAQRKTSSALQRSYRAVKSWLHRAQSSGN